MKTREFISKSLNAFFCGLGLQGVILSDDPLWIGVLSLGLFAWLCSIGVLIIKSQEKRKSGVGE